MTGPALIRDRKTGRTFIASWVELGDRAVTFEGRLRHIDCQGEPLYPARLRTLPLVHVEIEWRRTEVAA